MCPDTIRYTFQYRESHYTQGVWADIGRLKEQGFELHKLKNSWSDDQYKGINSQWIDPDSGQRFEVQFHTRISFEAKQLTHDAYERLRSHQADKFEQMVLGGFPEERSPPRYRFRLVPPTFLTIRREAQMPDKVTYYAIVNDLSSRERPAGVFRRTYTEDPAVGAMKHLPEILYGSTARRWSPPSVATCKTSSSRSPRTRQTRSWSESARR